MVGNLRRVVSGSVIAAGAGLLLMGCAPGTYSFQGTGAVTQSTGGAAATTSASSDTADPTTTVKTTPKHTATTPASGGQGPVSMWVKNNPNGPVQRPAEFSAGGVGHIMMENINWSNWGYSTATGSGTLSVDRCDPDCASGGADKYTGTVTLTRPLNINGRWLYTRFTFTAPGYQPSDITTNAPTCDDQTPECSN